MHAACRPPGPTITDPRPTDGPNIVAASTERTVIGRCWPGTNARKMSRSKSRPGDPTVVTLSDDCPVSSWVGGGVFGVVCRACGSPAKACPPWARRRFHRVVLSMPGAPLLRYTATHARHTTSLRKTLSHNAWNRRPGSALAARYSACCRARTGSEGELPTAAGLAETALTGHLHSSSTHR